LTCIACVLYHACVVSLLPPKLSTCLAGHLAHLFPPTFPFVYCARASDTRQFNPSVSMEKSIDLQTLDDELRHRRLSVSEAKGGDFDRDRYDLARAGKQQVLKVSSHNPMTSTYNPDIG
jgi:hypothetical protein